MGGFKLDVEIPIVILIFSFMLTDSVYTNMIIYRTCYITLGYNKSECLLLGQDTNQSIEKLEAIVEPHASVINMVRYITVEMINGLSCLFIGPWSDRFGRKPLMICSLLGSALTAGMISLFSSFDNISPWLFQICTIPTMLCGGGSVFITAVLAFIADTTNESNRGLRMSSFEAFFAAGVLLGNLSSSYVFKATSYPVIFAIQSLCIFAALAYTLYFIPESLKSIETGNKFHNLVTTANIKEMFNTSLKKREDCKRTIVLISIVMLTLYMFILNGENSVQFLFMREKFHWTLKHYTLYSSINSLIWIFGTILSVYLLHTVLNIKESILILVGFLSLINGTLMQGLATKNLHIYIASAVRFLGGLVSPMVRTLISKVIPEDEIGKIFSLIMTCESTIGITSGSVYTAVYNATIKTHPEFYNFLSTGIYGISTILVSVIVYIQLKTELKRSYSTLQESDEAILSDETLVDDNNSYSSNGILT